MKAVFDKDGNFQNLFHSGLSTSSGNMTISADISSDSNVVDVNEETAKKIMGATSIILENGEIKILP